MQKVKWEQCTGEAHSNAYIDHCHSCVPFWGRYPVCPVHGTRLEADSKILRPKKVKCQDCKKFYSLMSDRYVFSPRGKRVSSWEEIPFIKVQELILEETRGKGGAKELMKFLSRNCWLVLDSGTIEWRAN